MLFSLFSHPNEDFGKVLLSRKKLAFLGLGLGLLTLGLDLILMGIKVLPVGFATGFYAGAGAGLITGSLAGLLWLRSLLRDEKKLRAQQIKETDERRHLAKLKALSATAVFILMLLYVVILLVAPLHKILTMALAGSILLFFAVFGGLFLYYEKTL